MKGVTAIDSTGLRSLERLLRSARRPGLCLFFPTSISSRAKRWKIRPAGKIGSENICPQIDAALMRAAELAE